MSKPRIINKHIYDASQHHNLSIFDKIFVNAEFNFVGNLLKLWIKHLYAYMN